MSINRTKVLLGLTFAGVLASLAATGAQAQTGNSYCISGGGGLMARCGFATFEQCRNASIPYGICVASERQPDPFFAAQAAEAKMISRPAQKHPKR